MKLLLILLIKEGTISDPAKPYLLTAIGALAAVIGVLYFAKEKLNTKHVEDIKQLNDKYNLKSEAQNDIYVNMLEKTLNGLTGIERMIIENNSNLSQKIIESIEKTNAPLISEIKELLKK